MASRFEQRVALVTGAGSGIGRAVALVFAREGASVVVSCRGKIAGEETVRLIRESGGEASFVQCDVSRAEEVRVLLQETVNRYKGLDVAVNNAGVNNERIKTAELSEAEWDRVIDTNLKGTWLCMKYEIPRMMGRKGAAIVNTSSVSGVRGRPNLSAYTASKHGLIGLTRAAAIEYAPDDIRINAICPGVIPSGMVPVEGRPDIIRHLASRIPMGRLGRAEEMAQVILWLCSEDASFVTGHVMVADGGESIP